MIDLGRFVKDTELVWMWSSLKASTFERNMNMFSHKCEQWEICPQKAHHLIIKILSFMHWAYILTESWQQPDIQWAPVVHLYAWSLQYTPKQKNSL